jgi:parallel beta-helix repeat protein
MYPFFGSVFHSHFWASGKPNSTKNQLSAILVTAFFLMSVVKPQRMLAADLCDLPAWNGTMLIDCDTPVIDCKSPTNAWCVEARACPTWSLKPVSGMVGGAVQLNYECETDPGSYVQAWYTFDPPVDLSDFDLFGISLRGSAAPPETSNRIRIMVADTNDVFFEATIGDIAHINRWMINIPLPQSLFTRVWWSPPGPIDWTQINRFFVAVAPPPPPPETDWSRLQVGSLTIDHIQAVRSADWVPPGDFASVAPNPVVAQKAMDYIVSQQCASTGLFRSWSDDPEAWAWLYDQALALLILARERRWEEADRLARFLVDHQKVAGDQGHWAIGWNYCDPDIERLDEWPGDQAWAAYALHRYAILRANKQALQALQTSTYSGNWLAQRIRPDGCVDTHPRGTSSTEGNFDVWMAMMELGRTEDADHIAQCLESATLWDNNRRCWQRGEGDPVVALNANAWPAKGFALHPRINLPHMALHALGFVRRTLATRSDTKNVCEPDLVGLCGLDFQGPISLHAEGMGSYIVAGGAESREYLAELLGLQGSDGGVRGSTEEWRTDTHWLTCWKGIAPTAWLYFAVSGSPFVDAPNVLYVDGNATGTYHDGSTWCNAFVHLQDALATAANSNGVITEIRVADGVYHPDEGENQTPGNRSATFQLINAVTVEGGYAGCGAPDPGARDINLYATILNGDLNGNDAPVPCTQNSPDCNPFGGLCADGFCIINDNDSENSYHVVTGSGIDATAIIDGFSITAGNADADWPFNSGGGMYNDQGNPTVTNCAFSGNFATSLGGGMFNSVSSSPTVTNCTFSHNSADSGDGGGMFNNGGSPTVSSCTFSGNSAYDGGGMFNSFSDATVTNCIFSDNTAIAGGGMYNSLFSNPTVTNCTFSGNLADRGDGGGMFNINNSSPTLTNCTFSGNSALFGGGMHNIDNSSPTLTKCTFSGNSALFGGGIYNRYSSNPSVTNCTFRGNFADLGKGGGGIFNDASSPTVTDCTFSENRGSFGGGMHNFDNSSPTLTNCTFSGNSAYDGGGGMFNLRNSNPTVTNCTFSDNSADNGDGGGTGGGGMFNENSNPTVVNCTFSGNSGRGIFGGSGGGMYNDQGNPTVTNCAFSGNTAGFGGGMYNQNSNPTVTNCTFSGNLAEVGGGMANGGTPNTGGSPTVTNCTFSGNSARAGGGGMFNSFSNPTVTNCILWNNGLGGAFGGGGSPIVTFSDVQGGFAGTGNIEADPLFADPDGPDNIPGTEDDDVRLQIGSRCMDAGNNDAVPVGVTTDLDGHSRLLCERVDMGGYESGIGDYDCIGTVNLADFANWVNCFTGPGPEGAPYAKRCEHFDFEFDGDVDLQDFAGFQLVFNGSK